MTNNVEIRDGWWQHHSSEKGHTKIYMLKGKILQLGLNKIKNKREKVTYPTAPLGGNLLESNVACSFGGSIKDKLEILMLGMQPLWVEIY